MKHLNLLFIGGMLWSSCSVGPQKTEPIQIENSFVKSQLHTENAVLWQQSAAEYKALCYQTYTLAKLQLEQKLHAHAFPYEKKPAIVMDLDETVVDNSFFNAQLLLDNEEYSKSKWKEWSDLEKAGAVPGAVDFIAFAQGKGVEVIFISNRRVSELQATKNNVEALGIVNIDSSHYYLRTEEGSKMNRRAKVSEDYEILMLFGDNLADFNEVFDKRSNLDRNKLVHEMSKEFGATFIVLPNVLYGEWEGSLYAYKYHWTPAQKDSIRKTFVVGYK